VPYLAEDQVTCLHEIEAFGWPPAATAVVPVGFDLKAVKPMLFYIAQTVEAHAKCTFDGLSENQWPTMSPTRF
jgi:hypothetical protein